MSAGNPYQDYINADGFVAQLHQSDQGAWESLIAYVRAQVAYNVRHRPTPYGHDEAIAEYVSIALLIIQEKLDQFKHQGPLSAWIDQLLRRAMSNALLKQTLQAVGRFLSASREISDLDRHKLSALIQQHGHPERELLQAVMTDATLNLCDSQQPLLRYRARRALIEDPQFQQLLHDLSRAGLKQAATLLHLYQAWKESEQPNRSQIKEREDAPNIPDPPDPAPQPLDLLITQETNLMLIECLEALRQNSPDQARAIIHKYLYQESYEQIIVVLDVKKQSTLRQRIRRGLGSLRKCVSVKLNNQE